MEYGKLVRDRIPEIIQKQGKHAETRIADDAEYIEKLNRKLLEEAHEFFNSGEVEELADILEVIYAIGDTKHVPKDALEQMRAKKASERGAFKNKIILVKTAEQTTKDI